jgi:hypothetical protein
MPMLLLRFTLIFALALWQGGFLFYALVVVPVGSDVVGVRDQGFITQRVSEWFNGFGGLALGVAAMEWIITPDTHRRRRLARGTLLGVNVLVLAATAALHFAVDQYLDADTRSVRDAGRFYVLHARYLVLSGVQWVLVMILLALTLSTWRNHGD